MPRPVAPTAARATFVQGIPCCSDDERRRLDAAGHGLRNMATRAERLGGTVVGT